MSTIKNEVPPKTTITIVAATKSPKKEKEKKTKEVAAVAVATTSKIVSSPKKHVGEATKMRQEEDRKLKAERAKARLEAAADKYKLKLDELPKLKEAKKCMFRFLLLNQQER